MVVDDESIGTKDSPGCGGKILRGDGALEQYLAKAKLKDQEVLSYSHQNGLCCD